jgi:hypothetical protein
MLLWNVVQQKNFINVYRDLPGARVCERKRIRKPVYTCNSFYDF